MTDFNEARFPLTKENVSAWARAYFPVAFRALPRAPASKWIEFDAASFIISRSVWRSLDRSIHKKLLIIGGYAPGPAIIDEPTDRVLAHVHSDEAEVSFYRIAENVDGEQELQGVSSTSAVAFHPPFCDVGEDTGGSKAIHRVSALILYYFLAAGHVKTLPRTKSDPTMFTRNFRDACSWIENGGERPIAPPTTRRSSIAVTGSPDNSIVVRPKRTSTISSNTRSSAEAVQAPAKVKRSATDDLEAERKKHDDVRPRKHPRRTLSEQIYIPILQSQESVLSPRSPAPERVNKALSDRIQHLKDENAGLRGENEELQQHIAREAEGYQTACEQLKKLEAEMETLRGRVARAEEDAATAKQDATAARDDAATTKAELATLRTGLTTKLRKTTRK